MPTSLVIDDDEGLISSLQGAAAAAGLSIATAKSWDEGLASFIALGPSLVVADYNMPGSLNGLRLLGRIRALRPSVRLVLFTAYLDEADMAELVAGGLVDRVLTKGSGLSSMK
jgi:CheY-like chemotaxis protein